MTPQRNHPNQEGRESPAALPHLNPKEHADIERRARRPLSEYQAYEYLVRERHAQLIRSILQQCSANLYQEIT